MAEAPAVVVSALTVREATGDWPQLWPMIRDVAREGRTFAYPPGLSERQARDDWMTPAPGRVVVACAHGSVLEVANMYANRSVRAPMSHPAA